LVASKKRIAATMYSLGTLFVSGIYVQIPCIKEIMMMIIIKKAKFFKPELSIHLPVHTKNKVK
jgi:hypothetical protein